MKRSFAFLLTAILALSVAFPEIVFSAVRDSMTYSASNVLPSLFCFMMISKLIRASGVFSVLYPLFRPLSNLMKMSYYETECFFAGNLCGFPSGACAVSELSCERSSGIDKAAVFAVSNNVSLGFATSFVGARLFGSVRLGLIIYLSQLISAVIICTAVRKRSISPATAAPGSKRLRASEVFCSAVEQSASSCISLTGYIAVFSVVAAFWNTLAERLGIAPVISGAVSSLIEITGGIRSIADTGIIFKVAVVSFSCAFSGLCVIFQSARYLIKSNVRIINYTFLKLLQGLLSSVISVSVASAVL